MMLRSCSKGLGAHREHIDGAGKRLLRLASRFPGEFLGRRVVVDDHQQVDVAVPGSLAARP
jgi:hypothetical protein